MVSLTVQIIILLACFLGGSFLMKVLFKTKPRQAKKSLAWTYEAFIILFGLAFATLSYYRSVTTTYPLPYLLMSMGGLYISITHVVSKKMGRYD